ncbi:MAG: ornithine cyclodeaminase family protein [Pseudomonadota bacterium]
MNCRVLDAEQVAAATPWVPLIDAIRDAFREGGEAPVRHHHTVPAGDDPDLTLLLMPAWNSNGDFGIKVINVAPANAARGLPTLHGVYLLFDGHTGVPRAMLDAGALTARRTAAASALASRSLSRADARRLLILGTGRVAEQLALAHCAVRPIEEVLVWGRRRERAEHLAGVLANALQRPCHAVDELEAGAADADVISAATSARSPLLRAQWIAPGTHVDLVGAFTPEMCEAEPALIARADQVVVDTIEGAREEAGELIQAERAGVFSFSDVSADLYQLCAADAPLRRHDDDVTLFKSVGTALEDLAAAQLCLRTN